MRRSHTRGAAAPDAPGEGAKPGFGGQRLGGRSLLMLLLAAAGLLLLSSNSAPAAPRAAATLARTPTAAEGRPAPLAARAPEEEATMDDERRLRVGLLVLNMGQFPVWWPFLVASYERNHPHYELIVVHSEARPSSVAVGPGVRYEHVGPADLAELFATKLGATSEQVRRKFASGKGLSDLKPFYGKVFEGYISEAEYSHWGWVDWDILVGDLVGTIPPSLLWSYDAVTFPGATLGFAWAGQLSIFRNTERSRAIYTVVDGHLALGLKAAGDGQSGWEERVLLRDTLKRWPSFSILFHMAAQFDYKAQWLTWVPFDHFWHEGRVWRCARSPLSRPNRPPLLVPNVSKWLADVSQIQADPQGFYARKDGRVCIRWDLDSSPWRCCPHSIGVSYGVRDGKLTPAVLPFTEAPAPTRAALAAATRAAGVKVRESSYDVCHEGGFFHAGLTPKGKLAPRCASGTWALQDDIGRFSGTLQLLDEAACAIAESSSTARAAGASS